MTTILRPSVIEQGDFLLEADAPVLVQKLRDLVPESVEDLLVFGSTYSYGGDIDILTYHNAERDDQEVIETRRKVDTLCEEFRAHDRDILSLWEQEGGVVEGVSGLHGVGPLLHLQSKIPANENGLIANIVAKEYRARGGRSRGNLNADVYSYAQHKATTLIDYASVRNFDPEDEEHCNSLGKVLSFAPHMARRLYRLHSPDEPSDKPALRNWVAHMVEYAERPEVFMSLHGLLEKEYEYRRRVRDVIEGEDKARQEYPGFLGEAYDTSKMGALVTARILSKKFLPLWKRVPWMQRFVWGA